MTLVDTAAATRVLLIIDAVDRVDPHSVSDLDLSRLAYFVDAFSPLWGLTPLDRYRIKGPEPRSQSVRRAVTRLVATGVVVPSDVTIAAGPTPHLSARYRLDRSLGAPILHAVHATRRGRQEVSLVDEIVFATATMLNGLLDLAVRHDAGFDDPRIGPSDVIDLASSSEGTTAAAQRFLRGVASRTHVEAELTHLYMAHLERSIGR